jgi:hypothetical protein
MSRQVIPAILNPKFLEMWSVRTMVKVTIPVPMAERAGLDSAIEKAQPQIEKISAHGTKLNDLTGKEWSQETATASRQRSLGASRPHTQYENWGIIVDESLGHCSLSGSGRLEGGLPGVLESGVS